MKCLHCMEEIGEALVCPHCGQDPRICEDKPDSLPAGSRLYNRFLVGQILGRGGFGITYIGYDEYFDCRVAIKEFFPSNIASRLPGNIKMFWRDEECRDEGCQNVIREARKMRKVDDLSAAVRVRDVFYENNTAYIAMDYVEGRTLKKTLLMNGVMTAEQCARFFFPLMDTMGLMHEAGIIHRDISPDNIMVQPDGRGVLLDLGAAKDTGATDNHVSNPVAKNGFSPFEQYQTKGKIGPWTDVYALCATIYYCLVGKVLPPAPDRVNQDAAIQREINGCAIGRNMAQVLEEGLRIDPDQRIGAMEILKERIEEALRADAVASGRKIPDFSEPIPATGPNFRRSGYITESPIDISRRSELPRPVQRLKAVGLQETEKSKGLFAKLKNAFWGKDRRENPNRGPVVPCQVLVLDPDAPPSQADPDATVCQGGDEDATVLFDEEPAAGQALHAWLEQQGTGDRVEVTRCCFLLGRETRSGGMVDCMIEDPTRHISRLHAAILYDGDNFYVQDISAKNVTQLNDTILQNGVLPEHRDRFPSAYRLYEGDCVRLAEEALIFHQGD